MSELDTNCFTGNYPKYLRVMADYSSTGLWDHDGHNVAAEGYPLSPGTLLALELWRHLYEFNDSYLDTEDRQLPLFDVKEFSEQGLIVAKMIKRDLPDYTIFYFDENALSEESRIFNEGEEDRTKFEYEVTL